MRTTGRGRGFTLVEVVIAMMILAFLSLFTAESIQRALKTKAKVQKDIDKNSTLRDALRIMERDINMAFNYRDPNIRLHNMAVDEQANLGNNNAQKQKQNQNQSLDQKNQNQQQTEQQQQTQTAGTTATSRKKKVEKIWTQFIGEPEALSFTSLSNVRLSEDSAISSQAEIGYRLKSCRRRSTQEQSSKCLWRRIANYIHEDITKEGQETVLLENVVEFKLRYLGPGRDDEWVDTWLTNERGDDVSKNKFPYAVEITIAIKDTGSGANDKSLRMTTVASIRNPNNIKEEPKKDANANPAPGSL
jgi:prepilin-type N-terminal cleavage/methylation domain-containing protein